MANPGNIGGLFGQVLCLIDGVELQEEPLGNVVVEPPDHPEGVVLDVEDGLGVLQHEY